MRLGWQWRQHSFALITPPTVLSSDDETNRIDTIHQAARLYCYARAIITDCAESLASEWHLTEPQVAKVMEAFRSLVSCPVRCHALEQPPLAHQCPCHHACSSRS